MEDRPGLRHDGGVVRYSEEEAKSILREAAVFDKGGRVPAQHGFTMGELEVIASEAGIERSAVHEAAGRLSRRGGGFSSAREKRARGIMLGVGSGAGLAGGISLAQVLAVSPEAGVGLLLAGLGVGAAAGAGVWAQRRRAWARAVLRPFHRLAAAPMVDALRRLLLSEPTVGLRPPDDADPRS